ncbi:hypothetical protein C8A05DRAFT_40010 [Staphylotrichum tortipilum]|uniref:Uncharacterized protein n=1 Tax=Staphylotrichum tortipilum TaxID=2831512 RepID=A0AAN6M8L1_9PEZI|nr:hypothetical protein C8A05DRAFT_40010 [Staphylotrichum longicolle]
MSAFVLPLQGFWNSIIYFVTSWAAVRMLADDVRGWCGRGPNGRGPSRAGGHHHAGSGGAGAGAVGLHLHRAAFQRMGSLVGKEDETESMTELAGSSRPGSSGSPMMTPSPTTGGPTAAGVLGAGGKGEV